MSLEVKQSAEDKGRGLWNWTVWLEGSQAELDEIEAVEYILHPTFSNSHVSTSDRASRFKLSRTGWGSFLLRLKIHRKDGTIQSREHFLELERGEGGDPVRGAGVRGHGLSVFLSFDLVDSGLAKELQEALEAEDIEVATPEDLGPGEDWQVSLSSMLDRSDFALAVISSEKPSSWVTREIRAAREKGIPVTSIVVGPEPEKLPSALADSDRIVVKGPWEVKWAGREVARRIKACA